MPSHLLPVQSLQNLKGSKRCYLLELAGKLRNHIYDYAIEGRLVEIRPPIPGNEIQYTWQQVDGSFEINKPPKAWRFSDILGRRRGFQHSGTKWESSLSSLILTCKQINREASHFLYAKTSFVFKSAKRTRAFLSIVQPVYKEVISRLHLIHRTYGQPFCLEHVFAKGRADRCWDRTCQALAEDLKGLKILEITLTVNDCPPVLGLREPWVMALLHLARLELLDVKVNLLIPRNPLNDQNYRNQRNRDNQHNQGRLEVTSVVLDSFAETIRRKILRGDDESALKAYDSAMIAYTKAIKQNN